LERDVQRTDGIGEKALSLPCRAPSPLLKSAKILPWHRLINFFSPESNVLPISFPFQKSRGSGKASVEIKKNIVAIVCAAFFQLLVHPFTQLVRKILVYG
jgi:hypothetical protein